MQEVAVSIFLFLVQYVCSMYVPHYSLLWTSECSSGSRSTIALNHIRHSALIFCVGGV